MVMDERKRYITFGYIMYDENLWREEKGEQI